MARARTALTISFSDPRGADGLQADLKTFASLGLHGASIATTDGRDWLSVESVAAQIDAVLGTMIVDVVKLTAPADATLITAIAERLARWEAVRVVLDPALAGGDNGASVTLEALRERLLPVAEVVTSNLKETEALSGKLIASGDDVRDAAAAIVRAGARGVVVKGGKREGAVVTDLLFDGVDYREFSAERVPVAGVRGAGSVFAAALAATLAKSESLPHSVAAAKAFTTKGLQNAYELGGGLALHHFYRYWHV